MSFLSGWAGFEPTTLGTIVHYHCASTIIFTAKFDKVEYVSKFVFGSTLPWTNLVSIEVNVLNNEYNKASNTNLCVLRQIQPYVLGSQTVDPKIISS